MVDALDLESSENFVRVQVSPSAIKYIKPIKGSIFL